jgi:ribosomal-protein-alanine N-acetyltransferase
MPVEPLSPSDLPAIMAIENRSFATPWTEEMYRGVLSDSYLNGIKWVVDGEIRGYFVYGLLVPTLEIMNVVVSPDHRREGIGRHMMSWVLDEGKRRGCTEAFLEVRVSNAAAIKLYESFSFSVIHTRPKYYRDGEDGLVMGLKLS